MRTGLSYQEAPASGAAVGTRALQGMRPMRVESLTAEAAATHVADWRSLATHCLEPNVFLEPDFALAAARHLAGEEAPRFLFVWTESDELIGVCPLEQAAGLGRLLPQRIWTHDQAPLGTPLLDRARAKDALGAILSYARLHLPENAGLMFPLLAQDGPVEQLLSDWAASENCDLQNFAPRQRPVLYARADAKTFLENSVTSARRRKLKKARSQLEAQGVLNFRIFQTPSEIERAAEAFFELEAKGWKGRRGTAFLQAPQRSAFAREMASKLAGENKFFIGSLELDGQPLAMSLMLRTGNRAFWWKITYDESFAIYSPGVLLAVEMTQYLLADPTIALTDSCASDENPMIEHIWSDRMTLADVLVGIDPRQKSKFAALARRESLYRGLRCRLKKILHKIRR
jgi:CelD/BcsL family acetyltransferase involved in cellulose biosynthesis